MRWGIAILALPLLTGSCIIMPWVPHGHAQEHHEQHHATYQNWVNQKGAGCCNDQDCGELDAENEREGMQGVEVRVENVWCPINPGHYLRKGNAPNWLTSHVCVQKRTVWNAPSPCERLLCYQPKPKV